jgi:DNA-binding response OmpR family regulator
MDSWAAMVRILVIEDEVALADAVVRGLRRHGMDVDVAYDGDEGYGKVTNSAYDVLVLDRDLPGMSGDSICRSVTEAGPLPQVLLLTASAAPEDRLHGLSLGASDYLTKPFVFPELVARVRALAGPI